MKRSDASIVYCSGRDRYAPILPEAKLVNFPQELQVMKDAPPAVTLLALTILSPIGQKILVDRGFRPVTLPSE